MDSYGEFSRIYDELVNEDIDYTAFADFIKGLAFGRGHYLDAACGTGNMSVLLAPRFKTTTLVDLSPDMLTIASEKLERLGVSYEGFCIPMEEMRFSKTFSLVTSILDSVNYLIEEGAVERFFKAVFDHLEDDGLFVFDINSPYKLREVLGNNEYLYTGDDIVYTWENFLEGDLLEMQLNFFIRKGTLYERVEEHHTERVFSEKELSDILLRTGFKSVTTYDGYTPERVTETTERITFVARKQEELK
ncbi:MAG TPA: class I SAM-dependent methyltransferase [Clostridiaceae bacterium]|nr:class I SAM-dependent methyltransferase [Clostridiaceae bacterium]